MSVGRNQPCPCGSGKKHKVCCLVEAGPTNLERAAAIHQVDRKLIEWMLDFQKTRFGPVGEIPFDPLDENEFFQAVVPWLLFFRNDGLVARTYLEERGGKLAARERAWIEACVAARYSFWEVVAVTPGTGVRLHDRLTDEERHVTERTASQTMRRGLFVCARVVDFDGMSLLAGLCPRGLPPNVGDEIVADARRAMRVRAKYKPVPHDTVRRHAEELLLLWFDAVDELNAAPPPRRTNTDGDPLFQTQDQFDIEPGCRSTLIARLATSEALVRDGEHSFTVMREGNRMHPDWENTVIGKIGIGKDGVALESNSVARADALRRRFEALAGDTVRFKERIDDNVLDEADEDEGEDGRVAETPEVTAMIQDLLEKHALAWADMQIPALGGRTPREAVRTAAGRRDVEKILRGWPEDQGVDIVRRELKLDVQSRDK
jgi:hypothetical protein